MLVFGAQSWWICWGITVSGGEFGSMTGAVCGRTDVHVDGVGRGVARFDGDGSV